MEENKKNEVKMISVEQANSQIQKIMEQAQQQMQKLAGQCKQLEDMLRDRTIDHMFKVLKYSGMFDLEFVDKCATTISEYITHVALEDPTKQEPATIVESGDITKENENTESNTEPEAAE